MNITILVVKSSMEAHSIYSERILIKGRGQREMAGVCQDAVADGAEVAAVSTPYLTRDTLRTRRTRVGTV